MFFVFFPVASFAFLLTILGLTGFLKLTLIYFFNSLVSLCNTIIERITECAFFQGVSVSLNVQEVILFTSFTKKICSFEQIAHELHSPSHCSWMHSLHLYIIFMCMNVSYYVQGDKSVQWEFVHGLLENAIYGGRIDNPSDLRILRSYLEQFFSARLFSSSAGLRKSRGGHIFPPQISLPNSCSVLVGCHINTFKTKKTKY